MEVALQTIRTIAIKELNGNVYELEITPIILSTGKFDGLAVQFIQCSNWADLRLDGEIEVCKKALKATYQVVNIGDLPREERHFKWLVAHHVDNEIDSYAKAGIVLVREDFPMYRAAKRALDETRERAILAKDYYELTQVKGANRIGYTFRNVIPAAPLVTLSTDAFSKG